MAAAPKVTKRPKPVATPNRPTSNDKVKKARKPRKPLLERAEKLVATLEKKCAALVKNVGRWRVENPEHAHNAASIKECALQAKVLAESMATSLGDLLDAGVIVATAGGGGGRAPMTIGDLVILRANRYDAEIHGANDFEIVSLHDKLYRIKSRTNDELHYVPRQWIKRQVVGGTDGAGVEGTAGDED